MKYKLFLSILLCSAVAACHQSSKSSDVEANNGHFAVLTFTDTIHNFGEIKQGGQVHYAFDFTNTGSGNLIIKNAIPSCGCTIPETPKKPFAPGEKGTLNVIFNSSGKQGHQEKTIFVLSNAKPSRQTLKIICDIIKPNQ